MDLMLDILLISLTWFLVCFLYYIVLMELHYFFGRTWWVKILAAPFLIVFDFPLNTFVFTVLCVDLPREWTVTARMKRYRHKYSGFPPSQLTHLEWWRSRLRWYICDRHLDKYDSITGDHC